MPVADDKLVCLRNNKRKGLFNGGLWTIKERAAAAPADPAHAPQAGRGARAGDRVVKVSVRPGMLSGGIEALEWPQRKKYDEFDFGYVLTVHKAQGSQWDDVVLFDESFALPETPRPLALHRRDAGGETADGGCFGAGIDRSEMREGPSRISLRSIRATTHDATSSPPHRAPVLRDAAAAAGEGVAAVGLPFALHGAPRKRLPVVGPVAERIAVPGRLRRERRKLQLVPDVRARSP